MSAEYKVDIVRKYATRFGLSVFVETGTNRGDNVAELLEDFERIYSIELSPELHGIAKERFPLWPKVELLLGDSGSVLWTLLTKLHRRNLFWLDAHFCGDDSARGATDTPIMQELDAILTIRPDGVILIDDADCFNGTNGYPTLEDLESYVKGRVPIATVLVQENVIRIV